MVVPDLRWGAHPEVATDDVGPAHLQVAERPPIARQRRAPVVHDAHVHEGYRPPLRFRGFLGFRVLGMGLGAAPRPRCP